MRRTLNVLVNTNAEVKANMEAAVKASTTKYTFSTESIGALTIRKQKGVKFSIGQISIDVDKWISLLHDLDLAKKVLKASGFEEGMESVYHGLSVKDSKDMEEYKDEKTVARVIEVSFGLNKQMEAEFNNCQWNDANLTKFIKDKIKVGRLYQEKTIDYAKKVVELEIDKLILSSLKPLSVQQVKVEFDRIVGQVKTEIVMPNGDPEKIIVFEDEMHKLRMDLINDFTTFITDQVMPIVDAAKLNDDIAEELDQCAFGDIEPFVLMKNYYKDVVGGFYNARVEAVENDEEEAVDAASETFKEEKNAITNTLRMATAYMTPEERGAMMKFVSGRTSGNAKAETENRFYMSICKEENILWLLDKGLNDVDFSGWPLIANKEYVAGDYVWFEHGRAANALIEDDYTGLLEIKEFDGKLYAAMDIADALVMPAIDNRVIMKVKQSFVTKHGADNVVKALNSAEKCQFLGSKGNNAYSLEIACNDGKSRFVPYDLSKWFIKVLAGNEGTIHSVSKNKVTDVNGNPVECVYVVINLDTIPEVKAPIVTEKGFKKNNNKTISQQSVTEEFGDLEESEEI